MSSSEICLPPDIVPQEGMTIEPERITSQQEGDLGSRSAIVWEERNRSRYSFAPAMFKAGSTKLAQWQAFMRDIAAGGRPFWLAEAIADTHQDLLCGPPADGTRFTFPVSCMSPTAVTVLVDGVPTSATVYPQANLLEDVQYNADGTGSFNLDATNGVNITLSRVSFPTACGLQSLAVAKYGGGSFTGAAATPYGDIVAAPGNVFTAGGAFFGAFDFKVQLLWLDSGLGVLSASDGATVTGSASAWTVGTVRATAPAATAYVAVKWARTTSSAGLWYSGARFLAYGDYDRAHRPSCCPGLAVFAAAPAANARVTATATGKKIARCWMNKPIPGWKLFTPGRAQVGGFSATETAEQEW